jgi:hypothetical protein
MSTAPHIHGPFHILHYGHMCSFHVLYMQHQQPIHVSVSDDGSDWGVLTPDRMSLLRACKYVTPDQSPVIKGALAEHDMLAQYVRGASDMQVYLRLTKPNPQHTCRDAIYLRQVLASMRGYRSIAARALCVLGTWDVLTVDSVCVLEHYRAQFPQHTLVTCVAMEADGACAFNVWERAVALMGLTVVDDVWVMGHESLPPGCGGEDLVVMAPVGGVQVPQELAALRPSACHTYERASSPFVRAPVGALEVACREHVGVQESMRKQFLVSGLYWHVLDAQFNTMLQIMRARVWDPERDVVVFDTPLSIENGNYFYDPIADANVQCWVQTSSYCTLSFLWEHEENQ